MKQIEGQWFTGGFYFLVNMKKQNFDIGLIDDMVTPWLVSGICPEAEPEPIKTPNLEQLEDYGFEIMLEIEPRVWEKDKIYRAIKADKKTERIQPNIHFAEILAKIDQ